jgi:transcriptional antiterminator RfaH
VPGRTPGGGAGRRREEITGRAGADGLIELQPAALCKGEALRIASGALADCRGLFERMADRDRVILLLDLLGRKVRVEAPRAAVTGA